ncbi:MAG TPA: hypothetical protein VLW50_03050 [Streptosporangiaceae bacterium]|nr:hypothetical protein [Streptosporangiaceae bacterium]
MIRRLQIYLVMRAAEAKRAYRGRCRGALDEQVSTGEWLTIQECADETDRRRNSRTRADAPLVSPRD